MNKRNILEFEVYNKTAVILEISANKAGSATGDVTNFSSADVLPMAKRRFTLVEPRGTSQLETAKLKFTFKNGEEFLYNIEYLVPPQ